MRLIERWSKESVEARCFSEADMIEEIRAGELSAVIERTETTHTGWTGATGRDLEADVCVCVVVLLMRIH